MIYILPFLLCTCQTQVAQWGAWCCGWYGNGACLNLNLKSYSTGVIVYNIRPASVNLYTCNTFSTWYPWAVFHKQSEAILIWVGWPARIESWTSAPYFSVIEFSTDIERQFRSKCSSSWTCTTADHFEMISRIDSNHAVTKRGDATKCCVVISPVNYIILQWTIANNIFPNTSRKGTVEVLIRLGFNYRK